MTTPPDPVFASREADLAAREAALAAREAAAAHDANVAFAEDLVANGKLLPSLRDKVVAIFDALPGHASVQFADGAEKLSPGAALREVLSALPKVVTFGEQDLGRDPSGGSPMRFAADGKHVDTVALATHEKALAHQRANPGTDYLTAVRAVS